jgi:hypothetical protein
MTLWTTSCRRFRCESGWSAWSGHAPKAPIAACKCATLPLWPASAACLLLRESERWWPFLVSRLQ